MFCTSLRGLRIVGLALGLLVSGSQLAHAVAPAGTATADQTREPFAPTLLFPSGGGPLGKWFAVWRRWTEERKSLDVCRNDRSQCSPAATEFLEIVDDASALSGKSKLGHINRAVNLAIRYVDDFRAYGMEDLWTSPFETLARHAGDCEDYAIVKFAALLEAGVAAEDVRMLIVRNSARDEDHAVVSVRLEGQWLILDNRGLRMFADTELTSYTPLLVLHTGGVQRYGSNVAVAPATPKIETASFADPRSLVQ